MPLKYKITNNDPMLTRQMDKPGVMLTRQSKIHNPMLTRQLKLISAKGVAARAKLPSEQRKEIASKAANARWHKGDKNEIFSA